MSLGGMAPCPLPSLDPPLTWLRGIRRRRPVSHAALADHFRYRGGRAGN